MTASTCPACTSTNYFYLLLHGHCRPGKCRLNVSCPPCLLSSANLLEFLLRTLAETVSKTTSGRTTIKRRDDPADPRADGQTRRSSATPTDLRSTSDRRRPGLGGHTAASWRLERSALSAQHDGRTSAGQPGRLLALLMARDARFVASKQYQQPQLMRFAGTEIASCNTGRTAWVVRRGGAFFSTELNIGRFCCCQPARIVIRPAKPA